MHCEGYEVLTSHVHHKSSRQAKEQMPGGFGGCFALDPRTALSAKLHRAELRLLQVWCCCQRDGQRRERERCFYAVVFRYCLQCYLLNVKYGHSLPRVAELERHG